MESTQADCAYADLDYVDKNDTSKVVRHRVSGCFNTGKLKWGWMPPHPTYYMKRELYRAWSGFNLKYKIASDYDSVLRFLQKDGLVVGYLPTVTMKMRVGGASNNTVGNLIRKMKEEVVVMSRNNIFWPVAVIGKRISKLHQFFNI